MANLKRVPELLAHLKKLKESGREDKWNMGNWLVDLADPTNNSTITYLRHSSNPECGTAGCLAGHMVIMDKVMDAVPYTYFKDQLDLAIYEADYVTLGKWCIRGTHARLDDAIRYLEQVIEHGTVWAPLSE